jgi:hypothetical protein
LPYVPAPTKFDSLLKDQLPCVRCAPFINAYYRKPKPGMVPAARGFGLESTSDRMICIDDLASEEAAARATHAQFVSA